MASLKPRSNVKGSQSTQVLRDPNDPRLQGQRGQLVIEYVLLLAMVTTIGMLLITLMVGRGGVGQGGTPGLIVQQWMALVNAVVSDMPDN
ncbi:MAG: hypothetical protein M9899_06190 [Bdellovibrionaceae bacterium]|nr:hypothetical protein [Pseudobdellovibrionaceae bacterium]